MTSAQVVETPVIATDNNPSRYYTHPDGQSTLLHVTPGFKPFTGRPYVVWCRIESYHNFHLTLFIIACWDFNSVG